MRTLAVLTALAATFTVLTACSSHWSIDRTLAPVDLALDREDTAVEVLVELNRVAGESGDLHCESLFAGVDLRWSGPEGRARIAWIDEAGEVYDDEGVDLVDGSSLGYASAPFRRVGADRCEATLWALVAAEAAVEGQVIPVLSASDGSPAAHDEPEARVRLGGHVLVEPR